MNVHSSCISATRIDNDLSKSKKGKIDQLWWGCSETITIYLITIITLKYFLSRAIGLDAWRYWILPTSTVISHQIFLLARDWSIRATWLSILLQSWEIFPNFENRACCVKYIPLTNRVRGAYCKLRTKFQVFSRAGHKSEWKKRGSVTYSRDRENEVSKIFIIYYIDTDEIPGFFRLLKIISLPHAVKILFLSFTCEDIAVNDILR